MEEEGEEAGRRCGKILINVGTCVWGAPTMLGEEAPEEDVYWGAQSQRGAPVLV